MSEAIFGGARFEHVAQFVGATFDDRAFFSGARFTRSLWFMNAEFIGEARFNGADLGELAGFKCTFRDQAYFQEAHFGDRATFEVTKFFSDAFFERATFGQRARFEEAVFHAYTDFEGAVIGDGARFDGVTFTGPAHFNLVKFGDDIRLGPLLLQDFISISSAKFGQNAQLEITGGVVRGSRAIFPYGARIAGRWTCVDLAQTKFGAASTVASIEGRSVLRDYKDEPVGFLDDTSASNVIEKQPWRSRQPCLLSLRGADVTEITLADIDLRACRFNGAFNLDKIRLDQVLFLRTPTGWQCHLRRNWLPTVWKWTDRLALAEEHEWRETFERGVRRSGWHPNMALSPEEVSEDRHLAPTGREVRAQQIANLYRALRKSLEDRKDEPGAADFYYGEMEMRRKGAERLFERALLTIYWCVSGYALRASRALASLAVTILVCSLFLAAFGFAETAPHYSSRLFEAIIYSFQATTSLLRAPTRALTDVGSVLDSILRLLGPLLYGLVLLSLRGRIKR